MPYIKIRTLATNESSFGSLERDILSRRKIRHVKKYLRGQAITYKKRLEHVLFVMALVQLPPLARDSRDKEEIAVGDM